MAKPNETRSALRSEKTWEIYKQNRQKEGDECFFCGVAETGLWNTTPNDYPYDMVAQVHDLLFPTRHVASADDLNTVELQELKSVLKQLSADGFYDAVMENFPRARTVASHYHLHLFQWKREQN